MAHNQQTVLLFGSGGFIGRNIKEQLSRKYRLLAPRSRELNLACASKLEKYLRRFRPDVVINAAVRGGSRKFTNDDRFLGHNLQAFFNLVRLQSYFGKLIHFGSGAEYDKSRPLVKIKEKDFGIRIPADNYGLYKYICSQYIAGNSKIICLRPFGVFGKYEDYSIRFISYAVCCALFRLPIHINQNVVFDYLYIDDLVTIVDWFIVHQPAHQFYNVGRGTTIELKDIAQRIKDLFAPGIEIKIRKQGLANQYSCDIARLKKEIPNQYFTDFNQSLKELFYWYQKNQKSIRQKSLFYDL